MPFLIRFILQRLLILLYSFLAFIGISPEVNILTDAEANIAIEERKSSIADFFKKEETREKIDEIVSNTKKINDEIKKIDLEVKIPDAIEIPVENPKQTIETKVEDNKINQIIKETVQETNTVIESITSRNEINNVVVNIVCSEKKGNLVSVSTGSGVMIDPEGIVITNAHVGQFVLIEDNYEKTKPIECSVYKENVPTLGYKVDILYISPEWIRQNYKLINSKTPRGTGEFDYAFLYITESMNSAKKKPSSFPYSKISLNEKNYDAGTRVSVAGYPGAPSKISDILSAGILKKDLVSIIDVFTFNKYSVDVIATSNTNVGARGASGGGVFNSDNELIAIISTTNGEQYNAQINAITTTYVNDSLRSVIGKGISSIVDNPESQVASFDKNYGSSLAKLLVDEMN